MKTLNLFTALFVIAFYTNACGQFNLNKIKSKANAVVKKTPAGGFSEEEAGNAIKEALEKGTNSGVGIVSKPDGYFKSPEIKIPFPPEAKSIEDKLRQVGAGEKVDEAVESINRAAEDAAIAAKDIFIKSIKSLTVKDAINIIKGEKNAATEYLKRTVGAELKTAFMPKIKVSLDKVGATKHWTAVMTTYNKIPFVKKVNPDLSEYVTDIAIYGLFVMIAKEELKIRDNPVARTTDLLKKVFGAK